MHCFKAATSLAVLLVGLITWAPATAQVQLVNDGEARAVVVTADEPSATAAYAAEELVSHLEKATGHRLEVVKESAIPDGYPSRIFVGVSRAAIDGGVVPEDLADDEWLLRTQGSDLYILGKENERGPLDRRNNHRGTLFGVYDLLERYLGVRWLWPGELGTHVPKRKNLVISGSLDERQEPKMRYRDWWTYQIDHQADPKRANRRIEPLSFTPQGLLDYRSDLSVYLARHRMGETETKPPVLHTFTGLWNRLGKDHPEWFMLNPNGQRGPRGGVVSGPGEEANVLHVAMCVSNPEFHEFIVNEWWDGGKYLILGEVDVKVFCHCEKCREWDGPQPKGPSFVAEDYNPLTSLRYARLWKTVYEMAKERNPDVIVGSYLYWNYMPAPPVDIELNPNIYGEFVPWTRTTAYYPMGDAQRDWIKKQWLGWEKTGMTLAYRPNYFHGGYVMPHLDTWQTGDMIKFTYDHGMRRTKMDSLMGHWSVKGPMLYMHMRLMWDPEMSVRDARDEYFAGFGPAAGQVERYFNYWEEYSRTWTAKSGEAYHGWELFYPDTMLNMSFPQDVFPPAANILKAAMSLASRDSNPEFAERVKFLQVGLEHAYLCVQLFDHLDNRRALPTDPARLAAAKEALQKVIEFRREHEHLYFADLRDAADKEYRRVNINALLAE